MLTKQGIFQRYTKYFKNGYTLVADCKFPTMKPASRWKLRLFSKPLVDMFSPERPLEGLSTHPNVQDFEDTFQPNKHNILFRYKVKIKDTPDSMISIQLTFGLPNVPLKLQLLDNDAEIFCVKGKGCVTNIATTIFANSPDGDESIVTRRTSVKPGSSNSSNHNVSYHLSKPCINKASR